MKKYVGLVLLLLCFSWKAFGLPVGNPLESRPSNSGFLSNNFDCAFFNDLPVHLHVGFYGDYIFNRHMRVAGAQRRFVRTAEIMTNAAITTLDVNNRLSLFATLGVSSVRLSVARAALIDTLARLTNFPHTLESESSFSWSIGLKSVLWETKNFAIGAEGQYFSTSPHLNFVKRPETFPLYLSNKELKYTDWQLGLAATYRIPFGVQRAFLPYVGVKYSRAFLHAEGANRDLINYSNFNIFLRNLLSYQHVGYCVGLSFVLDGWNLTIEKQFVDERSFSFNTQFQF